MEKLGSYCKKMSFFVVLSQLLANTSSYSFSRLETAKVRLARNKNFQKAADKRRRRRASCRWLAEAAAAAARGGEHFRKKEEGIVK